MKKKSHSKISFLCFNLFKYPGSIPDLTVTNKLYLVFFVKEKNKIESPRAGQTYRNKTSTQNKNNITRHLDYSKKNVFVFMHNWVLHNEVSSLFYVHLFYKCGKLCKITFECRSLDFLETIKNNNNKKIIIK